MKIYLESHRIYLREYFVTDEDDLFELHSDPEVMQYLTNGKPSTRVGIQNHMHQVSEELLESSGQFGVWMAIEKLTHQSIGWFHLFPSRENRKNYDDLFLGYRLKKRFWGQGYATEVSMALLQKAFQDLEAREVFAQAMKTNLRSQNVMRKIGMSFFKEFSENSFPEGCRTAVLFSIKRSDFNPVITKSIRERSRKS